MKRIALLVCLFLLIDGCDISPSVTPQSTALCKTEIVEVKKPDLSGDVGINDIIVPSYLPQTLSNGKEIPKPSIVKSGDQATISTNSSVLVEIFYTQDSQGFPELGKAEVTSQGEGYSLKMRLNAKMACTLTCAGIAKDELIRIANSFYLETGPQVP